MKKILIMILAAAMVLSMAACGKSDSSTVVSNTADSNTVVSDTVVSNTAASNTVVSKSDRDLLTPEEMEQLSPEQIADFRQAFEDNGGVVQSEPDNSPASLAKTCMGMWVQVGDRTSVNEWNQIEVYDDGSYHIWYPTYEDSGMLEYSDGRIYAGGCYLTVRNGVKVFGYDALNGPYVPKYVRQDDIGTKVKVVKITPENYQEYFEYKILMEPELDDYGDLYRAFFYPGLYLKDEFYDRFANCILKADTILTSHAHEFQYTDMDNFHLGESLGTTTNPPHLDKPQSYESIFYVGPYEFNGWWYDQQGQKCGNTMRLEFWGAGCFETELDENGQALVEIYDEYEFLRASGELVLIGE